jgi:formylmethanofuran dehydrogenase subunit E
MSEEEDVRPRYEYQVLEDPKPCSVCGEESEEGVEDHVLDAWVCSDCASEEGIL